VDYKKLVKEYELMHSKWLEVADLNKALKKEVQRLQQANSYQQQEIEKR
jgi:hypothetical protein